MRLRLGVVGCSVLLGCTRAATPVVVPPTETPVSERAADAPAVSTAELVRALVMDELWVDEGPAAEACARAGYPASLDAAAASELGPHALGARISVVHSQGVIEPTVVAVHCQAPDDDEPGMAQLELSASVPASESSSLMVAGLRLNPEAKLSLPEPQADVGAEVRATLLRLAEAEMQTLGDPCSDDAEPGEPLPALTDAAVRELTLLPVLGREGVGSFATFIVDRCERGIAFGVLLDPKGEVVNHRATNNQIEVLWITDLDGDGRDELALDITWLEDGMEEIRIEYRDEGSWRSRLMYQSESP